MSKDLCAVCKKSPVAEGDSPTAKRLHELGICYTCGQTNGVSQKRRADLGLPSHRARKPAAKKVNTCAGCNHYHVAQGTSRNAIEAQKLSLCHGCLKKPDVVRKRRLELGLTTIKREPTPTGTTTTENNILKALTELRGILVEGLKVETDALLDDVKVLGEGALGLFASLHSYRVEIRKMVEIVEDQTKASTASVVSAVKEVEQAREEVQEPEKSKEPEKPARAAAPRKRQSRRTPPPPLVEKKAEGSRPGDTSSEASLRRKFAHVDHLL